MSEVKAVIFDLGRVLVDVDTSKIARFFGRDDTGSTEFSLNAYRADEIIQRLEKGEINPKKFHEQICLKYGIDLEYDQFVSEYCSLFAPIEGMEQLVHRVSNKASVGLLSDTGILHWGHIIKQWPWLTVFDKPTLSFRTGLLKPDVRAYKAAADNASVGIDKCLFIDDLSDNVQGAIDAGMMSIRFEGVEKLTSQLEEILFNA